jgi:hypothetical protein
VFVLIDVGPHPPAVSLEEPEDTRRFHVEVRGGAGPADLALVFGALVDAAAGRLDGEDAWITIDALRRLAAGRVSPSWDADLAAMVDFARGRGWVDDTTHAIRAHVEWVP